MTPTKETNGAAAGATGGHGPQQAARPFGDPGPIPRAVPNGSPTGRPRPVPLLQDVGRLLDVHGFRLASPRPALHLADGTLNRRHQALDDGRHPGRRRFGRLLELARHEGKALKPEHAGAAGQDMGGPGQRAAFACGGAGPAQVLQQRFTSSDKGRQVGGNGARREEGGGPPERPGVADRQVRPAMLTAWSAPRAEDAAP